MTEAIDIRDARPEELRERIRQTREDLEQDWRDLENQFTERFERASERIQTTKRKAKEAMDLKGQVRRRPFGAVAASAAVGFALAMVSNHRKNRREEEHGRKGSRSAASEIAKATTMAVMTAMARKAAEGYVDRRLR